MTIEFSIIIPCFNEEAAVERTVDRVYRALSGIKRFETIVVDDGSTDDTAAVLSALATKHRNMKVITHNTNSGYGAALKTGIRQATGELIAMIDADDTYPGEKIMDLVELCRDRDMVIGARNNREANEPKLRTMAKFFLKRWVSWIARTRVPDINSGMRVFRKTIFERFFGILPDGFSFTITITLASLTNHYSTYFHPIEYQSRASLSKIRPLRDTFRFLALILRTGAYFAPVRVFAPVFLMFFLGSVASLIYDLLIDHNITDKTILLFLFAFNIAMLTLILDLMEKRIK